ncbi:MAG: UDP-3-O-[3-hydroxymyristoyl] N-acetylglucosamine deacetylase [Phycisphaeraceae bacterium]|nr:UDP-3-O-[3-hydroxymyristoyl] N-acetylglucosamine deacetylase [Phycisphaeraceae bacterium]
MQEVQRSIAKPVSLAGRGLFTGQPAQVVFRPAPPNHGIVFIRTDMGRTAIPALVRHVVKRPRRTALKVGQASVETCEHVMSAIAGLAIDNLAIEIDGPELPLLDGSAKPFLDLLQSAGLADSDQPRRRLIIRQPVFVEHEGSILAALPSREPGMHVVYDLRYNHPAIGQQVCDFHLAPQPDGHYAAEIAPARTFVLDFEAKAIQSQGMATHLTPQDVLVISEQGPLGGNRFRYDNEPVRHKIVDLIGDLYLLGAPIQGRVIATKSGHSLNHALVRQLLRQHQQQVFHDSAVHSSVMDIRRLSRMMPHRYPMLLVDRVIELDGSRRAVGIKNVTINEPFFQGHFPGVPIMPGVLIVEAMAQLSSVLVAENLEHTGKLGLLLSLDRVKIRKPVTPGDQLILEAESVRIRSRIAHMRCRAYVGQDIAAEAEIKFMLVDSEPVD